MFENVKIKKNPIGVEFIKRGLLTEVQVDRVLQYQKEHKELKFGEIVDILEYALPLEENYTRNLIIIRQK